MMALSDEDKAEAKAILAEARTILREDKVLAHNALMDERWKRVHGEDPVKEPDVDPNAPPGPPDKKPAPSESDTGKKKNFYWGEALDDAK
jgi:hypothetical protein